MNIGSLIATLGVDTTGLVAANAAMTNFQKTTLTSLNNMSQKFRTFGYLAGAAITLPIVMAGKATFKMAEEFEYSMQKIVGLTGVAQSAVNAWGEDILKLGPKYGKGPQELAEALYFVSSSGIQGARALNVVDISAKAAASGLGKTQEVADVLTSSLNAYAGSGLTAAYATDIMIAAVRVGKIEADQFASSVGQVIPIASAMNVELEQVAGGMAAISLTGSTASQAATYLKGILNSLWKESTKGVTALEGMNSSYAELRQILGEQGLIPLLQKVRDMSVKYGDTLASKIFPNIRALTGYLSIAGKNFEYNTEIMKEVTESAGALNAAWAAVSETIKIKFAQAISTAQVSMIKLGKSVAETILPILEWLVKALENITTRFDLMTEAEKRNKITKALWIAAAGPIALLISVVGYALSGITTIILSVIKVLGILRVVMLAIPGVAIATGITAIVAALIHFKRKTRDAAEAHNGFNRALVEVNETIKKLKELTSVDFEAMNFMTLGGVKEEALAQKAAAWKLIQENVAYAGKTMEEFYAGKRMGKWTSFINEQVDAWNAANGVIKEVDTALDKLADNFGTVIPKAIGVTTDAVDNLITRMEELAAINRWYLEQYAKRIESGKGLEYGFALDAKKPPVTVMPMDYQKFFMMTANFTAGLPAMEDHLVKIRGVASEMGYMLTNVFMTIGEGYKAMTDVIIQSLKRLAAEVAARIVIFSLLQMLSLATGGVGAAAGSLIEGGFFKFLFKSMGRGVGMAQGGIVPPGYPNDTYPARLTSGETITPPGKLDNVRALDRELRVVFVGKLVGKDMYLQQQRYVDELNSNT